MLVWAQPLVSSTQRVIADRVSMIPVSHTASSPARVRSVRSTVPAYRCPQCDAPIPPEALAEEWQQTIICRSCLYPQARDALVLTDESTDLTPPPDVAEPPRGCGVIERAGTTRIVCIGALWNRCEVRVMNQDEGLIVEGPPIFARRDRFVPRLTTSVTIEQDPITERPPSIVLSDGERHAFGTHLPEEARAWMVEAIRLVVI